MKQKRVDETTIMKQQGRQNKKGSMNQQHQNNKEDETKKGQ